MIRLGSKGQKSIWGHLVSLGSKFLFHLKCYNSSMLNSMTIRLIHVDQLETLYLCYGVKCQSGDLMVTGATVFRFVYRSRYTVAVGDCVFHLYDLFISSSSSSVNISLTYLRHDLTNFDQIWSQVPVDHPIYVICSD